LEYFFFLILTGILLGLVYGLIAMGFTLIYKCSSVLNLAHGAMILLSAYICWTFLYVLGLPVWVAILATLISVAISGPIIERLFLRPILGESLLIFVMITIGLSEIIRGGTIIFWGSTERQHVELLPNKIVGLGPFGISLGSLYIAIMVGLLLIALFLFFRYSRWGLALKGIADGTQIVRSMGLSVNALVALTWALAGIIAGLGGVALGSIMGIQLSLHEVGMKAIPAAIVGGLDSLEGAIVGGIVIGVIEALASGYVGHGISYAAAFLILVIVVWFRPHGLWGLKKIERV
jgi:branched-chain amino acid transport system permease protein